MLSPLMTEDCRKDFCSHNSWPFKCIYSTLSKTDENNTKPGTYQAIMRKCMSVSGKEQKDREIIDIQMPEGVVD